MLENLAFDAGYLWGAIILFCVLAILPTFLWAVVSVRRDVRRIADAFDVRTRVDAIGNGWREASPLESRQLDELRVSNSIFGRTR